jgi:hypothetical protein
LVPLTDNLFLRSQATGVQGFKALVRLGSGAYSVLVFLAEFLETRIIAERIEHWIEPEKRRSERYVRRKRAYVRYREQFLQSRDGAVVFAHFRGHAARISSGMGPPRASFSIGTAAIAFSMNANTADVRASRRKCLRTDLRCRETSRLHKLFVDSTSDSNH